MHRASHRNGVHVAVTLRPGTIEAIEEVTGHRFADPALLGTALIHASAADGRINSNERLEFLGDSVLGFIVCTHLFAEHPDLLEGELTKVKSNIVSGRVCAELSYECGFEKLMRIDKGVRGPQGLPESLLAGVFEAIVGALYLDAGLEKTRAFVLPLLTARIDAALRLGHQQNFKQVLQQCLAQLEMGLPQYTVLDEQGPDHAKCFEIGVTTGARRFPGAWGPSKKQAEQLAALAALKELGLAAETAEGEVAIIWPKH